MIVWGRTTSSNVMKVLWLLDELGLVYEQRDLGGPFGGTDTPAYRAMNPLGVVPSLEDDGYTLFESNSIMRYVCAARAPDGTLYPADVKARSTVDAWLDFQQTALIRPQSVVFQGLIRQTPEQRDQAAIAKAVTEAGRIWGLLDERLAARAYVAGEALTIADMAYGPNAHRWFNMPIERPEAPHLRRWYDALLRRPAFVARCAGPVV